jgi:hypothetical protein
MLSEFALNGAVPSILLERVREKIQLRNSYPPPPTLQGLGPETDWNLDGRYAGLRTKARQTSPSVA